MRSNFLMLGMLIPVAIAVVYYGGAPDSAAPRASAIDAVYAAQGANVVTGDVEDMLAAEAPIPAAEEQVLGTSEAAGGWLDALNGLASWLPQRAASEPLLVILVPGKEKLAVARNGVRDERISGETADAFVVDGERLVATDRDAAATVIMLLDWVDRPIQLVAVAPKRKPVVLRSGRRNSEAEAYAPLGSAAAEVAAVRGSDQARVQAAIDIVRSSSQ